jgi:hypothetical protein
MKTIYIRFKILDILSFGPADIDNDEGSRPSSIAVRQLGHTGIPETLAVLNSAACCGAKMRGLKCEQIHQL